MLLFTFSVLAIPHLSKLFGKLADQSPRFAGIGSSVLRLLGLGSGRNVDVRRRLGRVCMRRGSRLTCASGLLARRGLSDGLTSARGVNLSVRGGLGHTRGLGLSKNNVGSGGSLASVGGRRDNATAVLGSLLFTSAQSSSRVAVVASSVVVAVKLLLEL